MSQADQQALEHRSPKSGPLPSSAWRVGLVLALCLAALWLMRVDGKPAAAQPGAQAEAAGTQHLEELDRIERSLAVQPQQSLRQLLSLQASLPAGSALQLEVLSLRAIAASLLRDRGQLDQLLAILRQRPQPDSLAADAAAVGVLAQAQFFHERGELHEAQRVLRDFDPSHIDNARLHLRLETLRSSVYAEAGDIGAALVSGQECVRLADTLGQRWRHARALTELAMVYYRAERVERARQASVEALGEARLDPDPNTLSRALTVYGIAHTDHPDSSITQQAYAEALEQTKLGGNEAQHALALGNFADYLLRRGDYARALALSAQALPLAQSSGSLKAQSLVLHNMGIAKIGLKRLAEGAADVRRAIAIDEGQGAETYAAEGWAELGAYLEIAGDWNGAVQAYHKHRALIDRLLRDETRKMVLEAQERFDAERRAREIELLAKDTSLRAEQIRAHELELRLWAAVAGCVVLIALLLGLAYRRTRRVNEALKDSNAALARQGEIDPLTGLSNRRHFQQVVSRLAAAGPLQIGLYLIDIDFFKRINDRFGHAAGDAVLVETARRLRHAVRDEDLVVRWGGEEFLVMAPEPAGADPQGLAQRLLDVIGGKPVEHEGRAISVSASIGFIALPLAPHGLQLSWERAIDLADALMYLCKSSGRNRAFGLSRIDATDEAQLQALQSRLEAAWREGAVELTELQGPQHADTREAAR
jgi:diguanylate cyclase (GGDEF)-like protein